MSHASIRLLVPGLVLSLSSGAGRRHVAFTCVLFHTIPFITVNSFEESPTNVIHFKPTRYHGPSMDGIRSNHLDAHRYVMFIFMPVNVIMRDHRHR